MKKFIASLKIWTGIPLRKSDHDSMLLGSILCDSRFKISFNDGKKVGILFNGDLELIARSYPHSDLTVMRYIFIEEEYKVAMSYLKDNFTANKAVRIIDAGTNVGYTALYFLYHFPESNLIGIEPDLNNFQIATENLEKFIKSKQVILHHKALMAEDGKNILTKNDFRDGKDWGISVEESKEESDLKSVSINQLLKSQGWDTLDILKIDIEGAERFVFAEDADLIYLNKVKVLAIEIHDEFNIRQRIYDVLRDNNYLILNFGQTTFGVNKFFL